MDRLVDPRRFSSAAAQPPADRVGAILGEEGSERNARILKLRQAIAVLLDQGREDELRAALASLPDAHHYRVFWDAIVHAAQAGASMPHASSVAARVFALPLVLVAAATQPGSIPGVLPDLRAVHALFESGHVLGPTRSFGLSDRLCALEAIEALPILAIYNAQRELDATALQERMPAAAIAVEPGREQAHLRFLVGAGVGPAHAPGFGETAAQIGAWGMKVSTLLGKQLAHPGLQLLVLPRAPLGLLDAPQAGRHAQLEVALNLFVSNTLRRFRMAAGDPVAILSTHDDGDLRLTLSSALTQDLVEGFRWPLRPLDDLQVLHDQILQLLQDVRVSDVRAVFEVLPSTRAEGGCWFPRCDELDRPSCGRLRH